MMDMIAAGRDRARAGWNGKKLCHFAGTARALVTEAPAARGYGCVSSLLDISADWHFARKGLLTMGTLSWSQRSLIAREKIGEILAGIERGREQAPGPSRPEPMTALETARAHFHDAAFFLWQRNPGLYGGEAAQWLGDDVTLAALAGTASGRFRNVFPKTTTLGEVRKKFFGEAFAGQMFDRPVAAEEFTAAFYKVNHKKWGYDTCVEVTYFLFPNPLDVDSKGQVYFKPYVKPPSFTPTPRPAGLQPG